LVLLGLTACLWWLHGKKKQINKIPFYQMPFIWSRKVSGSQTVTISSFTDSVVHEKVQTIEIPEEVQVIVDKVAEETLETDTEDAEETPEEETE
jgi:hypothetical protein